jgi:predicted  nucleic acid-binding Zn-ribbon protein
MNQAAYLHRLQRIDTQIDQTEARLAEIERLFSQDERVLSARQHADDTKKALEKTRLAQRSVEHSVSETRIKMEQSESALYSGTIKNPKELQDLQREIASLKSRLSHLEEQQLEAMIAQEESEAADHQAQTDLTRALAKSVEEKAGLAGERGNLQKNRARLDAERAAAFAAVQPQFLETYLHLREQKKGLAVTIVEDNTCGVCGAEVRPAESQAARNSTNLIYCKSCGRILFAG